MKEEIERRMQREKKEAEEIRRQEARGRSVEIAGNSDMPVLEATDEYVKVDETEA